MVLTFVGSGMIAKPQESCWRLTHSNRVGFLVDGAAYFAAFREAVIQAERSVFITGWDIDTLVRLTPEAKPADGLPATLLAFLNAVCERKPQLRVYVLAWDFSVIYAFEREPLPGLKFGWGGHRRIKFALDGEHPPGASHHQKIVVVDDRVAFVGGLDLTFARWDTPEHKANDPRRIGADGKITRPMHDVELIVDAETAAALGELVRVRWQACTGEILTPPTIASDGVDAWPAGLVPDVERTAVAIARTVPPRSDGDSAVQEIATLTLRAIAKARRTIYIENQYLTSGLVSHALAERLDEPDGPEVIAVVPRDQGGWLEQSSMGVLRDRLLERLTARDRHGRLRVYFPIVPDLDQGQCLGVHSKVLIVDDDWLKVGSANLSNRSMNLDTECDLAIEVEGERAAATSRAIAALRTRLLAEHLDVEPALVDARVAEVGSLIAAVESLRGNPRTLLPLRPGPEPAVSLAALESPVCDPEQPIAADKLIEQFVPHRSRLPIYRSLVSYAAVLVALVVVAGIWRLTPLRELLAVERLVEVGSAVRDSPFSPLYVAAAYLVGGLLFFPITLLIAGTTLVFDPLSGFVYAFVGTLASASMTYGLGRLLGRPLVERFLTPRLRYLRRELRRRSFMAIVAARLLPVGNFSLINLLAGALQVRFPSYFVANVLGILPGILGFTVFADRLGDTVRNPGIGNILLLAVALAGILAALSLLQRGLRKAARSKRAYRWREAKES